jgi:hypothetical protein
MSQPRIFSCDSGHIGLALKDTPADIPFRATGGMEIDAAIKLTQAGTNRWEVYYQNYQSEKNADKPTSEKSSISELAKQKAIANYQNLKEVESSVTIKVSEGRLELPTLGL